MDEIFGKKKTTKEIQREEKRSIEKEVRNLEKEKQNLVRQEKDLLEQTKIAAKKGDTYSAKLLAKNIVQNRQQQEKLLKMSGQMSALKYKSTSVSANETMINAMKKSTNIMTDVNKKMDVNQMNQILSNYQKENMKMDMTDEMLDDVFNGLGDDEEEVSDAMNQVLDEIGLETQTKLNSVKTSQKELSKEDQEAEELLKQLGIKN